MKDKLKYGQDPNNLPAPDRRDLALSRALTADGEVLVNPGEIKVIGPRRPRSPKEQE